MTISLKHGFTSAKTDSGDTTIVRPVNWNAEHVLQQATNRLLGRSTAGTGDTEEIAPGAGLGLSAGSLILNGPAFRAYKNANQDFTDNAEVKCTFETEDFDTASCFATSRFTPNVAGYYLIQSTIQFSTINAPTYASPIIYKNGAVITYGMYQVTSAGTASMVSDLIYLNGTTDYVEIYVYADGNSTTCRALSGTGTFFAGHLVRGA